MSQRAPQTLSVKRKRTEAPVDALIFDDSVKRQRSEADIFFRRLTKPGDTPRDSEASTPTTERRFHLDPVSRARSKHVFIERRAATQPDAPTNDQHAPVQEPTPQEAPRPRKRPGTRAASTAIPAQPIQQTTHRTQPSEHDVRELEALSHKLEHEETHAHLSPSKYKPKAPMRRFAEREPEKAAALAARDGDGDGDAMDVDSDEYVIDTYIREALLPDASGNLPTATGTVGFLVLNEEDEDWWNGSDSDDKEFDTDDDDSNAEEYYANDYPEDELSEDDEFDRDPYKANHRHGSDDEEFNANDSGDDNVMGSEEDEDDLHYKMTVPKAKRTGYWGMTGQ
ncbi:hypothetical protein BU25DRAFT_134507 [Macroventuria anomochaeta]|uniref:Uncharacterized protein n=1 Tax=Macroventuria anomochaeta TaxID=301207 RepID=A0ACB6RU31_9PLEO|nr:uncharacterized protein BU25DRAFT_134507 [Macroventuria anomochaeta]KAF2624792.1 hypothetical protein BU25DRAFT_134507 [Macroventuria anomochaeta]